PGQRGAGARQRPPELRIDDACALQAMNLFEGVDRVEHATVECPPGGSCVMQTPELFAELPDRETAAAQGEPRETDVCPEVADRPRWLVRMSWPGRLTSVAIE